MIENFQFKLEELPVRDVLRALYRVPIKGNAEEFPLVKKLLGTDEALKLYKDDTGISRKALLILTNKLRDEINRSYQKEYILQELVTASQLKIIENWGIPVQKDALRTECQKAIEQYQSSYEELKKMADSKGIGVSPEIVAKGFSFPVEEPELNTQLATVRKLWKHTLLLDYDKLVKHIRDDRLYCKWENYATVSGRIQSHEPNVQGFPKVVRERCLVPSEGKVLIQADYVSQELVVMAILAKDTQLLQDIHSGVDLHMRMASVLFDKAIDQISEDERKLSKHLTFACLYGAGSGTLKEIADEKRFLNHLSGSAIQRIVKRNYPAIQTLEERCRKSKQLVFVDGSTMNLSDVKKQYTAVNRMIQGSGSIILKQVITDLFRRLPNGAKIVCLIHDEVLVEAPADIEGQCHQIVLDVMSSVLSNFNIKNKMPVDVARIGGFIC